MEPKFEVKGLSEIEEGLLQLGGVVGKRILLKNMRLAFKPVSEAVKDSVPVRTGLLRESLRLASRVLPGRSDNAAEVGVTFAKGKIRGEVEIADGLSFTTTSHWAGWRWHFLEFGTVHMRPHAFLRKAWSAAAEKILGIFVPAMQRDIQRAAARQLGSNTD